MIEDFIKSKTLQEFINNRFKDDSVIILPKNTFKFISTDNATFYFDSMMDTIVEVEEYKIDDLRPTDIVLDIGACIGAFSLKVASRVSHVYAVEPIMTGRLEQNIALNKVKNITVLDCALGNGEQELNWGNNKKKIQCISLSEIIKLCGGHIDFLKCDCEGGELFIKPEELKGIRRFEAEVHCSRKRFDQFKEVLVKANFEYNSTSKSSVYLHLVHAKRIV